MKVFAVIPARGGSKGLPGKNIRPLAGKPLLAYMIEAAQAASMVDKVFVSTDSESIAAVAIHYGAKVILRPENISGDTASSELALLHAIEYFGKDSPDILLLLQCTAPFTTPEDINGTVETLIKNKADSAFAAVPFHHFLWRENAHKAFGINHSGKERKRRQDLEPQYLEAGSVYAMRVATFLDEKTRFCGSTSLHIVEDFHRAIEIDDAADFYQCEAMHAWFNFSKEEREHYKNRSFVFPKKIGAMVCDFDGVFTDNAVYTLQSGEECVRCDRGDGEGISQLKKLGIPILVLSAEHNPVVAARCRKLKIECLQGVVNKAECLSVWLSQHQINWEEIIYVGNDWNDKVCLQRAGAGIVPRDAHSSARNVADMVLQSKGGKGALRELSDKVHKALENGTTTLLSSLPSPSPYYPGQKEVRPWGSWEVLGVGEGYCIKKITVKPEGMLSLQYHNHREETWKIIKGEGRVTLEEDVFHVQPCDCIQIKKKQHHRIQNTSKDDLIFIEIQTGEKLLEEDIFRIQDKYKRLSSI